MGIVSQMWGAQRMRAVWPVSARPTVTMVRQDLASTLTTLAPYAVVAVAVGLGGFILRNHLHRIQEDGLLVLRDPFAAPLYGGILLLAVYLAATAAITTAREREHGAVELLAYGPVSPLSYLLAKLCSSVLQYVVLLALLLGSYLLLAWVTGLPLRGITLLAMMLSVGPAAAAAALGLLAAALLRRVRPTVLVVLGLALGAVGLQVVREILPRLPAPEFHVNPVQVLRWAAAAASSITGWALPFGYVDRELSAVLRGDPAGAVIAAAAAGAYAAAVLVLAAAGLDRTGVRR